MLGEYRIFAQVEYYGAQTTVWKLTVTVKGVVLWVEEGVLTHESDDSFTDNDSTGSRRLFTTVTDYDTSFTSTSYDSYLKTDTFTVTLDSYDPVGC